MWQPSGIQEDLITFMDAYAHSLVVHISLVTLLILLAKNACAIHRFATNQSKERCAQFLPQPAENLDLDGFWVDDKLTENASCTPLDIIGKVS